MKKAMIFLSILITLVSCRADDEVKRGGEDDFCNFRDSDCRDGFICQSGVCQALVNTNTGTYSCADICARLDECGAGEDDCVARCDATFQGSCEGLACPWSADAVESFGTCIVDELTCEEARQSDAPDTCYGQIELADDRRERCDAFVAAAERCNGDADTGSLRSQCFLLGRTATDESWARTDSCVDRIAGGECSEIGDCFNTVFELNPLLLLGDDSLNVNVGVEFDG